MAVAVPSLRIGTEGQIFWETGFRLGSGFDAQEMQSAKSAFASVTIQPLNELQSNGRIDFQHQFIRGNEDMKQALQVAVDPSTSLQAMAASPIVRLLKDVQYNSTRIATVIKCTITSPPQLFVPPINLTEAAATCLQSDGPEVFLHRYGTHFIAGQVCQSSISILLQHRAKNGKDLIDFSNALNTKFAMVLDASSLSSLKDFLEKSNVETKVIFATTGSEYNGVKAMSSLKDIIPTFDTWKSTLRPEPSIAILKHYSLEIDSIPRPSSRWEVHSDLINAWQDLFLLDVRTRSVSRFKSIKPLLPTIDDLAKSLNSIAVSDPDWREDLHRWTTDVKEYEAVFANLYRPIQLRRDMLRLVIESQNHNAWPMKTKMYPGATTEFMTGLPPNSFGTLASDVKAYTWFFLKDREPETSGIVQKETLQWGHGDRIIVGMEAVSDREDHHNNGWFRLMEGGVAQKHVELLFETSHWRAGEWSVTIWHVDSGDYDL